MKKIYLLGAVLALGLSAKAQTTVINEDFENRALGSLNATPWDNWEEGGADEALDIIVTDRRAASGSTKSGYVGPQNENNGQDVLLKMPTVYTQGKITAEWKMFVPSDSVAYYNLQEAATPGDAYAFECYINTYAAEDTVIGGTSLQHKMVWLYNADGSTYIYAYAPMTNDQWFTVKQVMDLDNGKLSLYVDGVEAVYYQPVQGNDWPGANKTVASFDFFSFADENNTSLINTYYLDDVKVTTEGGTAINNVQKNSKVIAAYPNPCKEYINLSAENQTIDNVEVYNVFGQKVMSANTKASVAKLNTQSLASGVYTAKVTTKDGTFTKKFVVK